MAFSAEQLLAIQVSERVMSALSLVGSMFIMGTFLKWHYFRKPINRLVFYASFGNILANVATIISTSAIRGETSSALCQFQGVLIQWFMMADSLWVFCMALNVMLVFFHQYNSRQLRHLEKWYLLFAYGVPFIPAFIYIIVEKTTGQPIYGPATIWCWVDRRVEWLRIAFFYAPVWIVLFLTISIYTYTGIHIFRRRKEGVRSLGPNRHPTVTNPFAITNLNRIERTTEISVRYTSDSADSESTVVDPRTTNDSRSSFSSTRNLSAIQKSNESTPNYRAAITSDNNVGRPRVDATVHHHNYNPNQRRNAAMDGNSAAWSYFKVAFLMFAALFIVWVPSTINRLQQFIHKGNPIFGLNLASALCLPLQGLGNCSIYVATTWSECRRALLELRRQPAAHERKDSEHTLTTAESEEFEAVDMPLQDMGERGLSYSSPSAHAESAISIPKLPHTRANS